MTTTAALAELDQIDTEIAKATDPAKIARLEADRKDIKATIKRLRAAK